MKKINVQSINNQKEKPHTVTVEQKSGELLLDGKKFQGEWLQLEPHRFHLVWNNASIKVELINADYSKKEFELRINNNIYKTKVQDRMDLLLEELGMHNALDKKVNNIKAPMPGMILKINIEPQQKVEKGEPLLILEAMKMENVLKAPSEGVVKLVKVEQGQSVEKNQVLIEFE